MKCGKYSFGTQVKNVINFDRMFPKKNKRFSDQQSQKNLEIYKKSKNHLFYEDKFRNFKYHDPALSNKFSKIHCMKFHNLPARENIVNKSICRTEMYNVKVTIYIHYIV